MLKILVTRPHLFAEPLCRKIADWGGIPLLFPTIEICPATNHDKLMQQIQTLNQFDIAIFTSRPAARFAIQAMQQVWHSIPNLVFAALGPGTRDEFLQQCSSLDPAHMLSVLCPEKPPYESEALLKHPSFQNVREKNIILFRGNGGRMLLYDTLCERGAKVTFCETYQRKLPKAYNSCIPDELPDVVLVTSPQCLTNLRTLAGSKRWEDLQQCTFVMVGWRTYNLSSTFGIRHRFLADGADDNNLLQALTQLRNNIPLRNNLS